jgi:hypothetical protein
MGLPTGINFDPRGARLALGGFAVRDAPVRSADGVVKAWELQKQFRLQGLALTQSAAGKAVWESSHGRGKAARA